MLGGVALLVYALSDTVELPEQVARLVERAKQQATQARGLPLVEELKVAIMSRESVHAMASFANTHPDAIQQNRIAGMELVELGQAGPGYDFGSDVARRRADSTAGYYVDAWDTLYVTDVASRLVVPWVLVHEIGHALQDQHFELRVRQGEGLRDLEVALRSLFEGDADLIVELARPADDPFRPAERSWLWWWLGDEQGAAPSALDARMTFPYAAGLRFVRTAHAQGGWERVNQLYRRPPLSTEHIMHPERLLDAPIDHPQLVDFEAPQGLLASGWRVAGSDIDGELGLVLRLQRDGPMGDRLAELRSADGWDGDLKITLERDHAVAVLQAWVFDNERDAREAATALRTAARPPDGLAHEGRWIATVWGRRLRGAPDIARRMVATATSREARSLVELREGAQRIRERWLSL